VEKSDGDLRAILRIIDNEYIPFRVKELNLPMDKFLDFSRTIFIPDKVIDAFLQIRRWMVEKMLVVWPDDNLVDKFLNKDPLNHICFEAGQGMLLDQHRKEFMPYLTRSSTGIKNVLELLKTVQTPLDLDIFLVTRAYLTRHGDGPVFNHVPNTLPFSEIEEPTNVYNTFQGEMRYGYLNRKWYESAIKETEEEVKKNMPVCVQASSVNVAMTCCDHIGGQFSYCPDGDGVVVKGDILDLPRIKLISTGKTEKDVRIV
jgi:adenylosuccinate synthase